MMLEGCECWRQCCDLGPHACICGNDCPKPWSPNPDEWPHTPPLAVYRELASKDRNLWWRMDAGDAQNLLEEAIEQIDELAGSVREREAAAWDAAVRSMRYEDGTPVELVYVRNPYREGKIDG